jgi:hypothetical protein
MCYYEGLKEYDYERKWIKQNMFLMGSSCRMQRCSYSFLLSIFLLVVMFAARFLSFGFGCH